MADVGITQVSLVANLRSVITNSDRWPLRFGHSGPQMVLRTLSFCMYNRLDYLSKLADGLHISLVPFPCNQNGGDPWKDLWAMWPSQNDVSLTC